MCLKLGYIMHKTSSKKKKPKIFPGLTIKTNVFGQEYTSLDKNWKVLTRFDKLEQDMTSLNKIWHIFDIIGQLC